MTSTINYLLDRAAALGIDFLVVDESNGIFLPCNTPPLQSDLQSFMDIVDQRINAGIRTPLITTMAHSVDANWIWDALVYKNGVRRPGWFWYSGRPFLGVYSAHPFRTDFQDARYFIRYIANSASCVENGQGKCVEPWKSECKQAQKDLGNVWCWATVGQTAPLFSPSSEEITIQNGYSNVVACLDYWDNCEQSQISTQGFTADYYHSQWTAAVQHNPQIIVITSFGGGAGIEGGQIEARTDFQPPTLFEGLTLQRAQQWKGSLMTCGLFALNESLLPGQSWVSCDGVTRLIHQQDGNAVLYRLVGCNWSPIWSTDTFGRTTSRLVMQPNGNLVLYSQSNNVLWSSHTAGHPGAFLRVQDDCNMVVYGPGNEGALWSSGTSGLC